MVATGAPPPAFPERSPPCESWTDAPPNRSEAPALRPLGLGYGGGGGPKCRDPLRSPVGVKCSFRREQRPRHEDAPAGTAWTLAAPRCTARSPCPCSSPP